MKQTAVLGDAGGHSQVLSLSRERETSAGDAPAATKAGDGDGAHPAGCAGYQYYCAG